MRNLSLLTLAASAGLSFAGSTAKQAVVPAAVIPAPKTDCPQCLAHSGLFLGAGADFLLDSEEVYYYGRVGHEWAGSTGNYSQSLFLEVGWTEIDEDFTSSDVIPITINYEYKRALYRCLNFYIGGGVGVAIVDSEIETPGEKKEDPSSFDDDTEAAFVAQFFTGLTYCISDSVELYGGVRYLWSDNFGDGGGLDEWTVGAGVRVKF